MHFFSWCFIIKKIKLFHISIQSYYWFLSFFFNDYNLSTKCEFNFNFYLFYFTHIALNLFINWVGFMNWLGFFVVHRDDPSGCPLERMRRCQFRCNQTRRSLVLSMLTITQKKKIIFGNNCFIYSTVRSMRL